MFLVDISPSMSKMRTIELPGDEGTTEITNLQWALQFVKLKIQEMVRFFQTEIELAFTCNYRYSTGGRRTSVGSSHLGLKVRRTMSDTYILLANMIC